MEQAFDAYYKWLGIPPECQPPHHYRLLGLQAFEPDPDVIQAAADQRMMHLRAYQTGKHSEWSQRLLNEVAAAKVCLLNSAKKAVYDRQLQESLGNGPPPLVQPPAVDDLANPTLDLIPNLLPSRSRVLTSPLTRRSKPSPFVPIAIGLAIMAALLIVGIVYRWLQDSELPEITIRRTVAPSLNSEKHSEVRTKPQNVSSADPDHKNTEPPRSARLPSTDPIASKGTPQEDHSLPKISPQQGTVSPSAGTITGIQPDVRTSAPPESPKAKGTIGDLGPNGHETWPSDPFGKESGLPVADNRAVEPSLEAQESAMKLAHDLYKDDCAKARSPEEKHALAKKILDQAKTATKADVGTFVLFRLARDISAQALDGMTAIAAIDALAERYQVDVVKVKMELFSGLAKKARMPAQHLWVGEQAARLMVEVQADEDFDRAADLGKLAITEGGLAHDKDLATNVKACLRECQQVAAVVAQFKAAEATLAKTPDDPSANLAVGTYYCGLKDDWSKGLPCLAKGDDPELKTLAERELKLSPDSGEEMAALADAWWKAASHSDGMKKKSLIRRCAYWCERARDERVNGLSKVKVEKRLEDIARMEQESPSAVLAARPSVPINKWFPLLVLPNELIGWETTNCHFSYAKGRIELREWQMLCSVVAKDATIRAKVTCPSNSQVRLLTRNSKKGCYVAQISNGKVSILKQEWHAVGTGRLIRSGEDVLATNPLPRNRPNLLFEFGFSAVGDVLTAFVNGQPVLQAKDATFPEGSIGIGTLRSNGLYFSDVAMLIPNKESFVADRRWSTENKPSPAKSP